MWIVSWLARNTGKKHPWTDHHLTVRDWYAPNVSPFFWWWNATVLMSSYWLVKRDPGMAYHNPQSQLGNEIPLKYPCHTRWGPTSYKWSYRAPENKWVTGVTTPTYLGTQKTFINRLAPWYLSAVWMRDWLNTACRAFPIPVKHKNTAQLNFRNIRGLLWSCKIERIAYKKTEWVSCFKHQKLSIIFFTNDVQQLQEMLWEVRTASCPVDYRLPLPFGNLWFVAPCHVHSHHNYPQLVFKQSQHCRNSKPVLEHLRLVAFYKVGPNQLWMEWNGTPIRFGLYDGWFSGLRFASLFFQQKNNCLVETAPPIDDWCRVRSFELWTSSLEDVRFSKLGWIFARICGCKCMWIFNEKSFNRKHLG